VETHFLQLNIHFLRFDQKLHLNFWLEYISILKMNEMINKNEITPKKDEKINEL